MGKDVRGMKGPGTSEHKYKTFTHKHTHLAYHAALAAPKDSAQTLCWRIHCGVQVTRRNPGEPIILVLYGPWHFFFALFLEMMISGSR